MAATARAASLGAAWHSRVANVVPMLAKATGEAHTGCLVTLSTAVVTVLTVICTEEGRAGEPWVAQRAIAREPLAAQGQRQCVS